MTRKIPKKSGTFLGQPAEGSAFTGQEGVTLVTWRGVPMGHRPYLALSHLLFLLLCAFLLLHLRTPCVIPDHQDSVHPTLSLKYVIVLILLFRSLVHFNLWCGKIPNAPGVPIPLSSRGSPVTLGQHFSVPIVCIPRAVRASSAYLSPR